MYEELVKRLREKAARFDYDGWVDTAAILEEAADAIEELDNRLNLYRQGKITRPVTEKSKLPKTAKCEYYHADEQTAWHDVGVCYGTREKEHCEWGGDITKCGRLSDSERVSMAYRFERFGKAEQSPWISIKEIDRLPDDGVKVICISKNGRVSDCDCLKSYVTKFGNYDMTTHWMPLPEPPKEETE